MNLKYISPKKEIKPKTYQLNPNQTLFLGGLGRFDFVAGNKQGFTAYFDNELKLHRTKLEGASDFYDKHVGSLLVPPVGKEKEEFPDLVKHEFTIKDKTDIVFSGSGLDSRQWSCPSSWLGARGCGGCHSESYYIILKKPRGTNPLKIRKEEAMNGWD